MRILKVVCGVAILLNALHLAHAIHHFWALDPEHGAGFWVGVMFAAAVGVLSFTGGCLLIWGARESGSAERRLTGASR